MGNKSKEEQQRETHIPALEHEIGYDPVEVRAGISEAFFAGTQRTEVGCGLRYNIVEETKSHATGGYIWNQAMPCWLATLVKSYC